MIKYNGLVISTIVRRQVDLWKRMLEHMKRNFWKAKLEKICARRLESHSLITIKIHNFKEKPFHVLPITDDGPNTQLHNPKGNHCLRTRLTNHQWRAYCSITGFLPLPTLWCFLWPAIYISAAMIWPLKHSIRRPVILLCEITAPKVVGVGSCTRGRCPTTNHINCKINSHSLPECAR